MRKFLGQLGEAIPRPFPHAATLLLLISSAFCHAQTPDCNIFDYGTNNELPTINVIYPSVWNPGQTYTVAISGSWEPVMPAGCNTDTVTIWENSVYPYPLTNIDPYVTVSNITYVSATETDFTVTIAANAPTEYDAVQIDCHSACGLFNEVRIGASIQPPAPPPPPTATITDTSDIIDGIVTVNLTGPAGTIGDLTLTFTGSTQQYSQTFPALQPGSQTLDLTLANVTADTYTSVDGTWATNVQTVDAPSYTLPSSWVYFGYVRYTQYNVPYENLCTGAQGNAWLVTTSCKFTKISLNSAFISQAWLNGTGVSNSNGILKNAAAVNLGSKTGPCAGKYPSGAVGPGRKAGTLLKSFLRLQGVATRRLSIISPRQFQHPGVRSRPLLYLELLLSVVATS